MCNLAAESSVLERYVGELWGVKRQFGRTYWWCYSVFVSSSLFLLLLCFVQQNCRSNSFIWLKHEWAIDNEIACVNLPGTLRSISLKACESILGRFFYLIEKQVIWVALECNNGLEWVDLNNRLLHVFSFFLFVGIFSSTSLTFYRQVLLKGHIYFTH